MRILYGVVPLALAFTAVEAAAPAHAQLSFGINFGGPGGGVSLGVSAPVYVEAAPPPLPVYDQPPLPAPGYIWTPGYWAYDDSDGYYWVPGTWVEPPQPGLLWTPGYWGWSGGRYGWNPGYWGPTVGFYGGIDYGFGYTGNGYLGGEWDHGTFRYNSTVNNFGGVHVTNVYSRPVENNFSGPRVSFNGGNGGIMARPTPEQMAAARQQHIPPTATQTRNIEAARSDPQFRATANGGRPPVAAVQRPGDFHGAGVVAAREGSLPRGENFGPRQARPGETPARPAEAPRAAPGSTEAPREARPGENTRPEEAPRATAPTETPRQAPSEERSYQAPSRTESRPEYSAPRPEERAPQARPEQRAAPRPQSHPQAKPQGHSDDKQPH